MDSTTDSQVFVNGYIKSNDSTTSSSIKIDVAPFIDKINYQNDLILVGDIFLVAILAFISFRQAFKGLWK